ncbi:Protein of unknown function [Flavobacterium caeni]|uniref:DUF3987 domain-containing protein n=1 Tax=Flavobacterium caeni TaxID=490189 RepID=A0A1G5JWJ6_9FLAO|nr:Protein of unknown function [Flavobacterium caeni]
MLSGCLPNIKGLYFQKIVFANLYSFVVAPPASNKGALTFAKDLAKFYHQETVKTSKAEREKYEQELKWYKAEKRGRESDTALERPIEPPLKVVLIPGNASTAAIYMHLQMNGGSGIICETEADAMAQAFKQEWGSYSYIMRQAFHHESISSTRKASQEYVEIDEPKLSIALTGTPNQVKGIIPSAEDGLFSRFIFYSFESTSVWNDPSPEAGSMNLTEHFRSLSVKTNELVKFYKNTNVYFELTKSQWEKLNRAFDKYLSEVGLFVEGNADSIVKRHGLILYRICMILSAIRHFENSRESTKILCLDEDFDTALTLIDVYIQHSIVVFGNLPKQTEDIMFEIGSKKRTFFEALPSTFSRKEAVNLGKSFGIRERTTDSILKKARGKLLEHSDYGLYKKM